MHLLISDIELMTMMSSFSSHAHRNAYTRKYTIRSASLSVTSQHSHLSGVGAAHR